VGFTLAVSTCNLASEEGRIRGIYEDLYILSFVVHRSIHYGPVLWRAHLLAGELHG